MKKNSFIYRNPYIYTFLMKFLYGGRKYYIKRFKAIGEEIPDGVRVLEVCCGDCSLYTFALKGRVSYTGIDINSRFVKSASKKSINAICMNIVTEDNLLSADYVVMQASLYQFIPKHKQIVDKLLDSASTKVIISEPIRNLSTSNNPIISFIAKKTTNPGTGSKPFRFTEETFRAFFRNNYNELIEKFKFVPGGRELIVILNIKEG